MSLSSGATFVYVDQRPAVTVQEVLWRSLVFRFHLYFLETTLLCMFYLTVYILFSTWKNVFQFYYCNWVKSIFLVEWNIKRLLRWSTHENIRNSVCLEWNEWKKQVRNCRMLKENYCRLIRARGASSITWSRTRSTRGKHHHNHDCNNDDVGDVLVIAAEQNT